MKLFAEKLTQQFYEWEQLGRGWMIANTAIDLEPPFTPFFGHLPRAAPASHDDGVHHTLLSRIASLFQKPREIEPRKDLPEISYNPFAFKNDADLVFFRLHIPKGFRSNPSQITAFLVMLSYCTSPISVEYIASPERILMQIGCRQEHSLYLRAQLQTYFPEGNLSETAIELTGLIDEEKGIAVTDFGLRDEFMRPMAQLSAGSPDVLTGLFSILEHLHDDEGVIFQILFNGIVNQWEQSILRSVMDNKGGPFFEDSPEMLPMAKEKIGTPIFAATIRLLAQAQDVDDAMLLLKKLCFAITHASSSTGNALIPLPHESYTIDQRVTDIAFRESHRVGMLLNAKELAIFVHIPEVSSKKLVSKQRKTKVAPPITHGHPVVLGINEFDGTSTKVTVASEQRLKHTHVIGATGTGKSTLLQSLIIQDIELGNGVAVLDPHGDLIDSVLCHIPEKRMKDVIIVDPSDGEYPVAFNILKAQSDIEKEVLSSDLVAIFKRNSTSWGDQMNSVFGNALLAFLESEKGGTLVELRRFLIEKPYREEFLKTVGDPSICYYWQKEYPLLKTTSVGPILTRLDTFLRPKPIRNMVCQQNSLHFESILDSKKILLVKLSQGLIGIENSYLLGSFVVAKIHQAALARQARQERNDFYFYIDEFQHFITPSMAGILSGARKYRLGLILAHQDMQQLQKFDSEVAAAVIANTGTRICFRVGENDAKKVAEGFGSFESIDLQNLGVGEAIGRVERPEFDFSLETLTVQALNRTHAPKEAIIAHSRSKYASHRREVEKYLQNSLGITAEQTKEPPVTVQPVQRPHEAADIFSKGIDKTPLQKPPARTNAVSPDIHSVIKKKEETQHRYLQTLIKKMAEARGYKATIEAALSDGSGKIDVLLEKGDRTIACEVSITTDAPWEIHNIQKCLAASHDVVISCMPDSKAIATFKKKLESAFTKEQLSKIKVFDPEALFSYLSSIDIPVPSTTETTYKGYRVKVSYDSLTDEEMKRKRESVTKIVVQSLKRLK